MIAFKKHSLLLLISGLTISSCVPTTKFKEVENRMKKSEEELAKLKPQAQDLEVKNQELNIELDALKKKWSKADNEVGSLQEQYKAKIEDCERIRKNYETLLESNKNLKEGSAEENKKLTEYLQGALEDLQKKENYLKELEIQLNKKQEELIDKQDQLTAKQTELDKLSAELKKREQRIKELEDILRKKDEAVNALKDKVAKALTGFEGKGLTIEKRNGKVYVSMDEKLLFASGSTNVNKNGEDAIKELAKVLEQNADVNLLIEGHTDNVKMAGTGFMKDNWDLSVLRATSITRIIVNNSKIDPKRITAAGRSEFSPVVANDSPENKAKNRRTEIILTPKLDELLQILEGN